jgi:hypothetical protein
MSHCETHTATQALMDLIVERLVAGDTDRQVVDLLASVQALAQLGHVVTLPDLVAVTRQVLPFLGHDVRSQGAALILCSICERYVSDDEAAVALQHITRPLGRTDLVAVIRLAAVA